MFTLCVWASEYTCRPIIANLLYGTFSIFHSIHHFLFYLIINNTCFIFQLFVHFLSCAMIAGEGSQAETSYIDVILDAMSNAWKKLFNGYHKHSNEPVRHIIKNVTFTINKPAWDWSLVAHEAVPNVSSQLMDTSQQRRSSVQHYKIVCTRHYRWSKMSNI